MEHTIGLPEGTKFDFQNIDVKLYLALKAVVTEQKEFVADHGPYSVNPENLLKAELALAEFELSLGPLPEWAIARNWDYSLVPGAQLCTKDGRKTGNAHVLRVRGSVVENLIVHECITDAGSFLTLTEKEILDQFWVGDWISDPKTLIERFGVAGQDYGQP